MIISKIGARAIKRPDGTLDRWEKVSIELPAPVRMDELLAAAGALGLFVKPCSRKAWETAMKKAQDQP